jgi:hypothetical protein
MYKYSNTHRYFGKDKKWPKNRRLVESIQTTYSFQHSRLYTFHVTKCNTCVTKCNTGNYRKTINSVLQNVT